MGDSRNANCHSVLRNHNLGFFFFIFCPYGPDLLHMFDIDHMLRNQSCQIVYILVMLNGNAKSHLKGAKKKLNAYHDGVC